MTLYTAIAARSLPTRALTLCYLRARSWQECLENQRLTEGREVLARCPDCMRAPQISTTKGTGGDVIILEEAAYIDPGFFYETVAPLLIMGNTSLLAISTLTSEINFYTRLLRMRNKLTGLPMFV